jgi:hypothetical protein
MVGLKEQPSIAPPSEQGGTHELQTPLGGEQLRQKVAHTEPLHVPMHTVQRTDLHIPKGKDMNNEDDEFNRIEREADMRLKAVRVALKEHNEHLRANMSEYERGVIDGMQKQMQSSVDKAVNAMAAQKEWQGLTHEERKAVRDSVRYSQFMTAGEYAELVQKATESALQEKNA